MGMLITKSLEVSLPGETKVALRPGGLPVPAQTWKCGDCRGEAWGADLDPGDPGSKPGSAAHWPLHLYEHFKMGLIHLVRTDLFLLEVVTSSLFCMDLSVSQPWCIKKLS